MAKDFHFEGNRVVFHPAPLTLPFVYDDGGRAAAGFRGNASDCVCRAIAIATGKTYREVYTTLNVLAKEGRPRKDAKRSSARTGVHREVYDRYLALLGWRYTATMGIGTGCTVHLREMEIPDGRLIVRVSRHLVAVIDGVIHDTSDPSRRGQRCVYGYYRKTELHV